METIHILYILGLALVILLSIDRLKGKQKEIVHVERRGGPNPINQARQIACAEARDQWLDAHDADGVRANRRGDVYLCKRLAVDYSDPETNANR